MHQYRTRNFRVGVLVLGACTLFFGMLAFVIGSSLHTETVTYYILYEENVKGMVVGSRVNFQGVPVGAVEDIRFQRGNTLVEFSMDPSRAQLQTGTKARIDRLLVTGQVTIELEGWDVDGKALPAGSFIEPVGDAMTELMQKGLPGILESLDGLLNEGTALIRRVEELLGPETEARISGVLTKAETALDVLPRRAEELIVAIKDRTASLDTLLARAECTLAEIEGAAGEARDLLAHEDLRGTVAALRETSEGLAVLTKQADELLVDVRGTVGSARQPLRSALVEGRAALVAVRQLARSLADAPNSILYGVEKSEISIPAKPGR